MAEEEIKFEKECVAADRSGTPLRWRNEWVDSRRSVPRVAQGARATKDSAAWSPFQQLRFGGQPGSTATRAWRARRAWGSDDAGDSRRRVSRLVARAAREPKPTATGW